MPEGHTLHALARDVRAAFTGRAPRASSPQGRFADGAALLDGRTVLGAGAWGKQLFVDFEGDRVLHVHLGLYGTFGLQPLAGAAPPARGAVRLRLLTEQHLGELRGPTVCAVVTPQEAADVRSRLGPDPLRADADPEQAWARVRRSRRSIAELLMDQSVLAGVGNVYRSETLFRHRVAPAFAGHRIKRSTWLALWADLVRLMPLGVATGRIVTDEQLATQVEQELREGRTPSPARRHYVYRRAGETCRRCGSVVRTAVTAGRNVYWCAGCQRRT